MYVWIEKKERGGEIMYKVSVKKTKNKNNSLPQ